MASKIKVAIIGAGICGIAAGKTLQQNNLFEVKIFEASDRVGGRIWTHYDRSLDDIPYKFEYGANWIHGTKGNPIHEIALENHLYEPLCSEMDHVQKCRYKNLLKTQDGVDVPSDIHRKVYKWYRNILDASEQIYQNKTQELCDDMDNVGAFISEKICEKIEATYGNDSISRDFAYGIMRKLLIFECIISGSNSMDDVSLSQFGSYRTLGGKDVVLNRGYGSVVQYLACDIPESDIILSTPVTNISYPPDSDVVKLTCENGKTFDADVVIVTASLGFLKENHQNLFTPALSEDRVCALQKLHIGTVDKIFLHFENFDFLSEKLSEIHVSISEDAFDCSDPHLWYRKIPGFDVESDHPCCILVAWVVGSAAEVMETLTDSEVTEGCMKVLREALPDRNIPPPIKIHRSAWHSNPYTRGSYSYIPTGATVHDIQILATPIYSPATHKPVVLFGGEALHTEFYSTVHGALLSGQQQAELVIQAYSDNNSQL